MRSDRRLAGWLPREPVGSMATSAWRPGEAPAVGARLRGLRAAADVTARRTSRLRPRRVAASSDRPRWPGQRPLRLGGETGGLPEGHFRSDPKAPWWWRGTRPRSACPHLRTPGRRQLDLRTPLDRRDVRLRQAPRGEARRTWARPTTPGHAPLSEGGGQRVGRRWLATGAGSSLETGPRRGDSSPPNGPARAQLIGRQAASVRRTLRDEWGASARGRPA